MLISLVAYHVRRRFVNDAFIGFQYIDNVLAGDGFVFIPAKSRSKARPTSAGCCRSCRWRPSVGSASAAKILGWMLLVVAVAATIGLGKRLADTVAGTLHVPSGGFADSQDSSRKRHTACACDVAGFGLTLVPAILLASSFEFVYFPLAGMETALLAVDVAVDGVRGVAPAGVDGAAGARAGLSGPSRGGGGLSALRGLAWTR